MKIIYPDILEEMSVVRRVCSLGHRLRNKYTIPVAYPLKEVQFEAPFLWKAEYQLIADDLNCFEVNPFYVDSGENWVEAIDGNIKIRLNIEKSDRQDLLYQQRREHRLTMAQRKKNNYHYVIQEN